MPGRLSMLAVICVIALGECRRHHVREEQDRQNEFDQRYRRRYNKMPTPAERFRSFDEYLLSIRERERERTSTFRLPEPNEYFEGEVSAGQAQNEFTTSPPGTGEPSEAMENELERQKAAEAAILDRIRKERTTPKFACCALGQLAGNHGFHCNAKFYQHRIHMRNRNRAQTRQAALEDIEREPDYNERIWHTFGNCVRKHARSFHHCCYAARILGSESVDLSNYESRRF